MASVEGPSPEEGDSGLRVKPLALTNLHAAARPEMEPAVRPETAADKPVDQVGEMCAYAACGMAAALAVVLAFFAIKWATARLLRRTDPSGEGLPGSK